MKNLTTAKPATITALFTAVFTALLVAGVAFDSSAQQRTINDGVFTAAQAQSGKLVYEDYCAGCHSIDSYEKTWSAWENRNVEQLWYYILGEMPQDNPGFLSDGEYTDVVAYILSSLDFPAGESVLDPNNGMADIQIVMP